VADSLRPLEPHVGPRVRVLVPEARAVCRGPDNLALSGAVWRGLARSGAVWRDPTLCQEAEGPATAVGHTCTRHSAPEWLRA